MALRSLLSVILAAALAWLGGLVLGEYPFQGDGIQWLPILGGAGLGAAIAWVVNRCWGGSAPVWMGLVAGALATWGEVMAVQEDTTAGRPWPAEGWAAVAVAGGVAIYGIVSTRKAAPRP